MITPLQIDMTSYLTVYYLTDEQGRYTSNIVVLKGDNCFPDKKDLDHLEILLNQSIDKHLEKSLELINNLLGFNYTNIKIVDSFQSQYLFNLNCLKFHFCLWSFPGNTELIVNDSLKLEIKPNQILILENIFKHKLKFNPRDKNTNLYQLFYKPKLKIKLKKTFPTIT